MKIGYALCGSFCTHKASLAALRELLAMGHDVTPFLSPAAESCDTRFGTAKDLRNTLKEMTGHAPVTSIVDAEPYGPKKPLDLFIIAPCTGNTLSKLANGMSDTAVSLAAKAHLRSDRPLLIALASNDAMSANLKNIATLLQRKSVYFVPMKQDDPEKKPHSLVADFTMLARGVEGVLSYGSQLRPLFLTEK